MHPIAFKLESLTFHWQGILLVVAFAAGLWNAYRQAENDGLGGRTVLRVAPWLFIGAMAGARILYVCTHWDQFATQPLSKVLGWRDGGAGYGGLLGGFIAGTVYLQLKKVPYWRMADVLTSSVPLGYGIIRIGCYLNGCCYGAPTTLPWAVCYPEGHMMHLRGHAATPVHPTQLYDAIISFALFAAVRWFRPRKQFDGQVFCLYLMCYAMARSFLQMFRGDHFAGDAGHWTSSPHLISAIIYAGAFLLLSHLRPSPDHEIVRNEASIAPDR